MRGGAPYRTVNPFMGAGIMGGLLPRKRMTPPSIAEAQGRNMANVGLLPDYMQPGGTGLPSDQSGGMRSDIMPRNPGYGFNMPKPRSPFQMAPLRMKGGGETEKYPNEGLKALAKEAPEVVKRMGYEMGGLASYSNGGMANTYDVVTKLLGRELTDMEMRLFTDMKFDKRSAEEIANAIKNYRRSPLNFKFSDKIRVGPESGYKMNRNFPSNQISQKIPGVTKNIFDSNSFKNVVKNILQTGTKLPKFSLPSALLGLGSAAALNYFFDDEDVPGAGMGPGELNDNTIYVEPVRRRDSMLMKPSRTISDRDRMLMERVAGRKLSDQEIDMLIEKLQADE